MERARVCMCACMRQQKRTNVFFPIEDEAAKKKKKLGRFISHFAVDILPDFTHLEREREKDKERSGTNTSICSRSVQM